MSDAPLGLDHAGLTCADLERSLHFFRDLLGMTVRDRGRSEILAGGTPGTGYDWIDLELADGRVVELTSPFGVDREPIVVDTMCAGASHFGLRVSDIHATLARLAEGGFEPRNPPAQITEAGAWQGCTIVYVYDPDGHAVELVQRP
jgi:catechol 2,3-dioxygenase-like lactoylglutathione lyase family enzyme